MKTKFHLLLLFSMSTVFMTGNALAKPGKKYNPEYYTWNQNPIKFYPLAHSNQDGKGDDWSSDDERALSGKLPVDWNLTSGIGFMANYEEDDLLDLVIQFVDPAHVEIPIPFMEFSSNIFEPISSSDLEQNGLSSLISQGQIARSDQNAMAKSLPPAVPAPGMLGLLAIAGLASSRRRRRL